MTRTKNPAATRSCKVPRSCEAIAAVALSLPAASRLGTAEPALRVRRFLSTVGILSLLLSVTSLSVLAAELAAHTVVSAGSQAPVSGTFDRFQIAAEPIFAPVNDQGEVAFFATLRHAKATEGIFLAQGRRIRTVALAGGPAPGGGRFASFSKHAALALGRDGTVVFDAAVTGGKAPEALLMASGGKLHAIAFAGAAAPGVAGGYFAEFDAPAVNDAGDVVFLASVRRGRDALDVIYHYHAGKIRKLAAAGDPVPDGGTLAGFGVPALNNKGAVAFTAVVEGGPVIGGVFLLDGNVLRLLAGAGNPAPEGGIFSQLSERVALNGKGTVAFSAVLKLGPATGGMFAAENGAVRALAKLGDEAPGGGKFASFGHWPGLAESGSVAFVAATEGGSESVGVFVTSARGLQRIANAGGAMPDGTRLGSLTLYPALAMSANGAITLAVAPDSNGNGFDGIIYLSGRL